MFFFLRPGSTVHCIYGFSLLKTLVKTLAKNLVAAPNATFQGTVQAIHSLHQQSMSGLAVHAVHCSENSVRCSMFCSMFASRTTRTTPRTTRTTAGITRTTLRVVLVVLGVFLVVLGVVLVDLGVVLVVLNIEQNIEHRTLFSEQFSVCFCVKSLKCVFLWSCYPKP